MVNPPDYISHPNIKIEEHLKAVYDLMITQWNQIPVKPILVSQNKDLFDYILALIALFHDFGKFNQFFQNYIKHPKKNKMNHPKSHHALLSALAYVVFIEIMKNDIINYLNTTMNNENDKTYIEPLYKCLKLIGFEIILRHHGNLKDMDWETNYERNEKTETFKDIGEQINTIINNQQNIDKIITPLLPNFQNNKQNKLTQNLFNNLVNLKTTQMESKKVREFIKSKIRQDYNNLKNLNNTIQNAESFILLNFILFQTIFSILIDSDKKIAHNINYQNAIRKSLPDDLIRKYKEKCFPQGCPKQNNSLHKDMNQLREDFFNEVIKNLNQNDINTNRILSINAPTGIGKTLTAIETAFKLREKIQKQKKYTPRIIYCLPFTSIIDQNHQIIHEILSLYQDYSKNESLYLLKHHHLADFSFKQDDEYLPNETATMLIESWESEIIVTTFVQLFQTMFGYQNRTLKKFTKLLGSIIILDEIQNIPPEYWYLFQIVTDFLAKNFGTYILFLTATRPAIYDQNQFLELGNPDFYFKQFDRITLQYRSDLSDIHKITEFVVQKIQKNKNSSFIIIMNTIKSSIETYENLINTLSSKNICYQKYSNSPQNIESESEKHDLKSNQEPSPIILYLSTNLIPIHRKKIINKIKTLNKINYPYILVCTQLIEAGVDITANYVIRDIAPLDSIIQSAGRCNRNNTDQKQGEVIITNINSPKKYAEIIYSPVLLQKTINILILDKYSQTKINTQNSQHTNNPNTITESAFRKMTEDYFQEVKKDKAYTTNFIEIINNLKFSPGNAPPNETLFLSQIQLIQNENKNDYFIELDNTATDLKKEIKAKITLLNNFQNQPPNQQNKNSYFTCLSELKTLKKKINEYTVHSFAKPSKLTLDPELEVYCIPASFYDDALGLSFKK